ncbi:hypothetical protein GYH30_039535 [Glycine max]|uniref:Uncharacterized protein n=2 Tax=Glycine subgen. Soja TaxID=1462606 RepID=A0A0R0GN31_SOYBN|nr:hypothetical protein GYH30_039535 [Glycine max]RZB68344.1 hypothetical protein D0Y65_038214 [Glycine soja]
MMRIGILHCCNSCFHVRWLTLSNLVIKFPITFIHFIFQPNYVVFLHRSLMHHFVMNIHYCPPHASKFPTKQNVFPIISTIENYLMMSFNKPKSTLRGS